MEAYRDPRRWDRIRKLPTTVDEIPRGSRGVHESCLRAYQILGEVRGMLDRGDSTETVLQFIAWCETPNTNVPK